MPFTEELIGFERAFSKVLWALPAEEFKRNLYLKGVSLIKIMDLLGRKLESKLVYLHFSTDRNKDTTNCLVEGLSFLNEPGKVVNLYR